MPRFQLVCKSCPALVVEDDANGGDLGERLAEAQREGKRFVTFFLDPPDEDETKKAAAAKAPPPEPELVVSGSFDATDVVHILAFDEIEVAAELEGEPSDEDEDDEGRPAVVNPRMFGKKK